MREKIPKMEGGSPGVARGGKGVQRQEKVEWYLSESDLFGWVQFSSLELVRIFKFIKEISF